MTTTDDVADDVTEAELEPYVDEKPRRSAMAWVPWILVGVLAATAVVLTWVVASLDSERETTGDYDHDVARVAGEFAEALFTYDHRDLEGTRDRVMGLATGSFRKQYDELYTTVEQLITKSKARSAVTVNKVFVTESAGGEAEAVALIDTTSESANGTRALQNVYLDLSLVEVDGQWKVADVSYPKAVAPESLGPPAAGEGSSSTTAP
jgi:hypothetical protein